MSLSNELLTYINIARKAGTSDEQIKNDLLKQGWDAETVRVSLEGADKGVTPIPSVPTPKKAGWVSGWDAFEHTLMFASLFFAATSFGLTLHNFVDKFIEPLENNYSFFSAIFFSNAVLTGALATLLVTFPLFAFLHLNVVKRTLKNPAIRSLKARKFFIYLSLFVTFIIMVKKIIQTVYAFLSGNFTTNFLFHFLVTVGVSGLIFLYYLYQVREDRKSYA